MTLTALNILESPDYYPLKFDGSNLLFVRMSRDSYFQSIFTLPNRIVTAGPEQWSVPFSELVELVERAESKWPTASCLFQIGHCGSTLLSRALDQPDTNLVIREPFILRQFAASPAPIEQRQIDYRRRGLQAIWHLLSRQYKPSDKVLIKANVPVNFAIDEIMDIAPEAKGVMLYSNFDDYLLSILKADERQQWARHVVQELMPQIKKLDAFAHLRFSTLDGAQSAAVLWLSQIRNFESAMQQHKGLRSLYSQHFYQQPARSLNACSAHLGLGVNREQADEVVASELFTHHAKLPEQSYSELQRQQEIAQLSKQFTGKISQCHDWLDLHDLDRSNNLAEWRV